jgi:2-succinyl-5-enolpyruvyl-6-hydroxy-3-cyclohexene-1-carboxylate synthase
MVPYTVSDERSAGFIALGISQSVMEPVVIVCTSGTSAYNLAPAVAEAFFSHTPLIIMTADRPAEWIAQHDGQTIFQPQIYGKHVKESFQLPQDYDHEDSLWSVNRIVNDAINLSLESAKGPVHINAPFREPLYPTKGQDTIRYSDVRVIRNHAPALQLTEEAKDLVSQSWPSFNNILLVVGQMPHSAEVARAVSAFRNKHFVPVVHDVISNLHELEGGVQHSDLFLGQATDSLKEMLRPDLLITFGDSLISKNLKVFLRHYPAKRHWHIQDANPVADTFRNLTDVFFASPEAFLDHITSLAASEPFESQKQQNYFRLWEVEERRMLRVLEEFSLKIGLTELSLVKSLLDNLPEQSNVHLANSMSVRYANFLGIPVTKKDVRIFCNRGTSGIDGSSSSAVGHALVSGRPNFLITGDLAFFYDRNAYWHNYPLGDFRILLLNNHGGLIFDVLEGPSSTPEARDYFITRQVLNAAKLCEEFGFDYLRLDHPRKTKNLLKDFLTLDNRPKVLELEGDTGLNKTVLEKLKLKIKTSYEL